MASSIFGKESTTISINCDNEDCKLLENPSIMSNTNVDESHDTIEPQTKKAKALTSDVLNFFVKIGVGNDGKEKCKCKACGKEYTCASKSGTSHLARHIPRCHMVPQFHDVGGMLIDHEGKLRRRKFDSKINREILSELIIAHDVPFNIVEWRVFRKYQTFLNEDCKSISRKTAKCDVMKKYEIEKEILKQQLSQIPGRVCLTFDCWTACTNIGYISLTAHYVDKDWKLKSKILSFAHMQPSHTGHDLALMVLEFLKDWGIERKIFSITLDNASSNDNMQNMLKEHLCLSNSLLLNGEFFHIRCSAHILNLIVQDGLKVASDALHKIRQSVHYVRASESRKKQFFQCVEQVGGIDTSIGLRSDCVTRWNSTYTMLESAINYRRAFHSLSLIDKNYKSCPSNDEWFRAISMCQFLKPFYIMTNLISGSSYPTSNLYFGEIWRIELLLTSNLANEDLLIQSMCCRMKEKFDKYWSEYSVVLAFEAILDPTKKLNFLRYTYSRLDPCDYEEKMKKVKKALYALFEEYRNKGASINLTSTSNVSQQPSIVRGEKEKLPIYDVSCL